MRPQRIVNLSFLYILWVFLIIIFLKFIFSYYLICCFLGGILPCLDYVFFSLVFCAFSFNFLANA